MEHLQMRSRDMVSDNMKYIAERWPECLTEAKDENGKLRQVVDFDKLRQVLSADATGEGQERYQFTWPDKRHAIRLANAPITDTLRPCREESVDWNTTQNLYIEGDNLNVLKLLRESYLGKVKMIYIDPPYNTGGDFVYRDNFIKKNSDYAEVSGAYDKEGNLLVGELEKNADSNGRFHTDWLNMIYPRLKVARDLLSEDGVIFISIDDHEVENLRKVCDEVFGERNFVGDIIIKSNPRGSMSEGNIASLHEHLLIYAKQYDLCCVEGHPLTEQMRDEYKFEDEHGRYRLLGLRMRGGFWRRSDRPKLFFPIYIDTDSKTISLTKTDKHKIAIYPVQPSTNIDGTWRWSKEKIESDGSYLIAKEVKKGEETHWDVFQKDYINKVDTKLTKIKSIWDDKEINYQNGTSEIKHLFGDSSFFDYPKPTYLLMQVCTATTCRDYLILDFFSGSATTAHAVMQLNAEDGGKRKFIMVQLPEETAKDSEAYKAGYKNICEIGKERIRRAGKKIKEESPLTTQDLDTGFRVLKLDSSNMQDVFYTPTETTELTLFADNIKPDRTGEDLLVQVMMELGIQLSDKIETAEIAGKTVWNVSDGNLMACFDADVNEDTIKAIAKQKPAYFVLADRSLASDNVADNFEQLFEEYSPDTVRRII